MSSVYSSYIKRMRMCANGNCKGCTYQYEGLTNTEECKEDLLYDAAEQLEDADKCNARLVKKCKEMEKRIAELEAQLPKWISMEDRLPEKMKNVLAANNRGKQWDIDKAWYNGAHFDRCGKRPLFHVTHWMPLPELPKGEQDG